MGNIINVKELAAKYKEDIKAFALQREKDGKSVPTLATVLVGDDEGSKYYLESQTKVAKSLNLGKVNITRIHDGRYSIDQLPGAQLAVAPQLLIEQGLLLLDHLRFQQQSADLSCSANVGDVGGLAQHARLVRIAQVGLQTCA